MFGVLKNAAIMPTIRRLGHPLQSISMLKAPQPTHLPRTNALRKVGTPSLRSSMGDKPMCRNTSPNHVIETIASRTLSS